MKKVLFVIHTLQVGGAERALINVLRHIDKSKYEKKAKQINAGHMYRWNQI